MTSKIKLTFLGTSDAIPSAKRNHSAILLEYNGENILVDCGEGTQRQFRKAKLNPCKITRLLITHWHGDHVLGIPGLLQTLSLSGYNKTVYIYGPKGTKQYMKEMMKVFKFQEKYKIEIEEAKGKFFETSDFYLEAGSMKHGPPTNAYNFVIKDKIRIDKNKLKKSKLPMGPLLQKLKQGKDISYKNKKYKAKDLTYVDKGKKISFVLDTIMHDKIISFAKNSDLLVCEASFGKELKEQAKEHLHLTSEQAATIAKKSKVGKLILTHISGRYEKNMKKILNESKKIFKNSFLVNDLDSFEV